MHEWQSEPTDGPKDGEALSLSLSLFDLLSTYSLFPDSVSSLTLLTTVVAFVHKSKV